MHDDGTRGPSAECIARLESPLYRFQTSAPVRAFTTAATVGFSCLTVPITGRTFDELNNNYDVNWGEVGRDTAMNLAMTLLIPEARAERLGASLVARAEAATVRTAFREEVMQGLKTGAERYIAPNGGNWLNRFPGVQVRQVGDYWVKRVNPDSPVFMQRWGQMTIDRQAAALDQLRAAGSPAANSRLFSSGRLVVEDVGTPLGYGSYVNPSYWRARVRDSKNMGTFINDLRPGNYGVGFMAFDPALDPIQTGIGILGGGAIGWGVYELNDED